MALVGVSNRSGGGQFVYKYSYPYSLFCFGGFESLPRHTQHINDYEHERD